MTEQKDIKTLQATGQGPAPCARFCEATAFKIEIAGWKRDQAENLANQCKLVDQVNALTAERDEYKQRMQRLMTTVSELVAERNAARIERDEALERIDDLTSEEHSVPELRAQLQETFEEKRKCYFAISQQQKANANLLKERGAYAKAADAMAASHKVERNELQETITAMCNAIPDYDWGGDSAKKIAALAIERDALKDAARLALNALHAVLHDCDDIDMVESHEPGRDIGPWQLSNEAITALKAVL